MEGSLPPGPAFCVLGVLRLRGPVPADLTLPPHPRQHVAEPSHSQLCARSSLLKHSSPS